MDRISFKQLFDALPSPHMLLDSDLNYVAANLAYEAVVNRRQDELVGRNIFEAFPSDPDNEARLRTSIQNVLETGERDTLAYIHYRIPRRSEDGGGFEDRYWTAVHAPLFDAERRVVLILQNTVDITELVRLRETAAVPFRMMPGELELVQRAREAEEAYSSAREKGGDFARLFEQAPGLIAVLQGPDHVFTFANAACRTFTGKDQLIGQALRDAVPELAGQGFAALVDEAFRDGAVRSGVNSRIFLRRREGAPLEEAFMDFSINPIRDRNGAVSGIFVQGSDRTDNVRAQQRQRLLLDELNHRVKNTLSSVQSIARQSFKQNADPTTARASFEARIQALSKAHDALSDRHWEAVDLRTIALQELSIFDPLRVSADGPPVRLSPKAAIAFAMVFHELASNAVKYGSLVHDAGAVDIRWSRSGGEREHISIEWRELGELASEPILQRGFGIRMLERIVQGELGGDLKLAFGEAGLICRIDVGVSEVEDFAGVS